MRYSSHLYLRTDGTFGKFPIIEVDSQGTIVSIVECGDTLDEMAGTRFFAGVIVPGFTACGDADVRRGYLWQSSFKGNNPNVSFGNKQELLDFLEHYAVDRAKSEGVFPVHGAIAVGSRPGLLLLEGFDLSKFDGQGVRIRVLAD